MSQTHRTTERIERGGQALAKSGRRVWLAGLGVAAEAEEQGRGFLDRLVNRGQAYQDRRVEALREAMDSTRENSRRVREWATGTVEQGVDSAARASWETLQRFGVPTYDDIRTLNERIEELNHKVESLGSIPAS